MSRRRAGSGRSNGAEEELRRVLPVLKAVRKELPDVWISVDTYKAQVAKRKRAHMRRS
ncbi:MAG: dihydropteroate synthase [Aquificota bacterium]|nr:dihydropteroate synthase [Aquificota bacterium]